MNTDAELASAFYPDLAAKATATAPTPAARGSDQDVADAFFGNTTKEKAAPATRTGNRDVDVHSDEQMAEAMYANSPIYESPKTAIQNAAVQEFLANPDDAAEIASSWEPTMRDFGLNSTEANDLTALGVSMTVNAPEPEVSAAWVGDAKTALRDDFGDKAGEALEAAQRLVARDPSLGQFLERTGLGNHPKFVRIAAAKAMALKAKGRL